MASQHSRVAVVTGARRGIGRSIALALADAGWGIVAIDLLDDDETRKTREALDSRHARHAFLSADIADVQRAGELCEQAHAAFGRVDALVNNAGVQVADRQADILHTSVESFDRLMNVNLRGTFFLTQAFARAMLAHPASDGAYRSIITMSSSNALHAKTRGAEYGLSKTGLSMLNKTMALQLAPHGIACFEVQPGLVKTEMNASMHAVYQPIVERGLTPIPRWAFGEDVGKTVVTLADGGLPFCTGQTIYVDGGLHIPKSPFESPFVRDHLAV
ncbi:3-ketoacyl-ACP reductase [Hydrogenophaga sp. BPS33]|uniref:3-ketoacyl-ACP reductase n=1 Tax=Hydrogenophaga sp. BPS33 TaxID=2651974 RepID=UPI00135A0D67|nr:3-ketoacyl-ACP reductase [Hydrogenophaga sp. BPS33]